MLEIERWHEVFDAAIAAGCDYPAAVAEADKRVAPPSPPPTPPGNRLGGITTEQATQALSQAFGAKSPEKPSTVAVALPRRVTREGAQYLSDRGERVEKAPYGSILDPLYLHYEIVHLTDADLRRAAELKMRDMLHDVVGPPVGAPYQCTSAA